MSARFSIAPSTIGSDILIQIIRGKHFGTLFRQFMRWCNIRNFTWTPSPPVIELCIYTPVISRVPMWWFHAYVQCFIDTIMHHRLGFKKSELLLLSFTLNSRQWIATQKMAQKDNHWDLARVEWVATSMLLTAIWLQSAARSGVQKCRQLWASDSEP